MTIAELQQALARLEEEREYLRGDWRNPDSDEDWKECNREIDRLTRLLRNKRSQ